MKPVPKFYPNYSDNNHCLQAALMMILNTLIGKTSWTIVNKETKYDKSLYSWTIIGAKVLSDRIKGITLVSTLDYNKFANEGEEFLKSYWRDHIDWYSLQKQHASLGFKKEQKAAQDFLKSGIFIFKQLTREEIGDLLKSNYLVTMIGVGKLPNGRWSETHFVLVYDQNEESFFLHDPGLPAKESLEVPKDKFMEAFKDDAIIIPLNPN